MEWKKALAAVSLGIIVSSGTVGFSYSVESKKFAPFVKVKRADVSNTGKTEMTMAYDFGYKILSGAIERTEMDIRGGYGNSLDFVVKDGLTQ